MQCSLFSFFFGPAFLSSGPRMETKGDTRKTADLVMRIHPALKLRLETLKTKMDRSVAWLVERCIEAHLPVLENHAPDFMTRAPEIKVSTVRSRRKLGQLPALRRSKK
jgi:hypothetical protein